MRRIEILRFDDEPAGERSTSLGRATAPRRWLDARRAPRLLLLGIVVFALGAGADLIFHTIEPWLPAGFDALLGPDGSYAHMVTLLGMLLICAGVIQRGIHGAHRDEGKVSRLSASNEIERKH